MRGLTDMGSKRTPKRGKCTTPLCRNLRVPPKKNGYSNGAKCHKCNSRLYRERNPFMAAYHNQKAHAKERGIEFRISFRHWKSFAVRSELFKLRGLSADALTVDRKDNLKGYVIGNLQVMTRRANSEKAARHDAIRMKQGFSWKESV